MKLHEYYIYIVTNQNKTVLYIGVTNNLSRRLKEHFEGKVPGFTQQYKCRYLIYYELFQFIDQAIAREKELKSWRREKKEILIDKFNPDRTFLNDRFLR
jgi:putative endonuclease